jgi:NCS1 family nucleobase:cation symporter-1
VVAPLGSITAVLSATALLATMGMNAYGGMLTVLTGIDCFKTIKTSRMLRVVTVIALAIVWYVIGASLSSSTSAVSAVLNSLTLMLYLLVPWTALNLVDFFFGLSYTGYFPAHVTNGVDYSWLVGLVVSGLVYLLLSRSLNLAAERSAIDASERELQAIDVVAEAAAIAEDGHPDGQAPEPALSRGRGADQQLARGAAGRQIAQRPGRLGQETTARPSTPDQARR